MALIQEPIIFKWKDEDQVRQVAPSVAAAQITLLINPEMLTINFKKIITRVRTKSRIVSFYWGQEPVNFSYSGQTGNLYPSAEIRETYAKNTAAALDVAYDGLLQEEIGLLESISSKNKEIDALQQSGYTSDHGRIIALQEELDSLRTDLGTTVSSRQAISSGKDTISSSDYKLQFGEKYIVDNILENKSHTDIITMSPKYQRFLALRDFYDTSQNLNLLISVIYRDWIFDGYFESFGFTDSARDPWNWKYSLSFTVLNWDKISTLSGYKTGIQNEERILVQDEPAQTQQEQTDTLLRGFTS